jgi:hypothetical protein
MLTAKFVTPDLKSPGNYEQLDYSNFGSSVIISNPDPKEYGQCARGIHLITLTENINFTNVSFTNTLILLQVEPEHIIFQENNGKIRVSQATPIKQLTKQDPEYQLIINECLKTPEYAYRCALKIDQQPRTDTRQATLVDSYYAYRYALDIDKHPRTDTRQATLIDSYCAYLYALRIDKKPRTDTRQATLIDPKSAYLYAKNIDQQPRTDTRNGTLINPFYAFLYAKEIDKTSRTDTRQATSNNEYWKQRYLQFESLCFENS